MNGRSAMQSGSRKNALDLIRRRYSVGESASRLSAASGQFMHPVKAFFALPSLPRSALRTARGASKLRRARRRRRAESPAAMAGAIARSGHRRRMRAVSPAGRRSVSARGDRACLDPERVASRANAAAGIPRAGGVAGGARLCRAGAGAAGPWRDRRTDISRTRAAATRPIMPAPGAPPRTRSRRRWALCASNPSSGRTARSWSGTRPAPGARWRWPAKTRRTSPPSSPLRRGAAATPMISRTRSARRIR